MTWGDFSGYQFYWSGCLRGHRVVECTFVPLKLIEDTRSDGHHR